MACAVMMRGLAMTTASSSLESSDTAAREARPDAAPAASVDAPARPRRRAPLVFLGLALVASGAFGTWRHFTLGRESTDDAQVEGHIINVSARVAGQVSQVLVRDNQTVHAGDVLVELDRGDLDARLALADADVDASRAGVASAESALALAERSAAANLVQARGGLMQSAGVLQGSRASIAQARADLDAAAARRHLAETELERTRALAAQGAIASSLLDTQQSQFDQAAAQWAQARARLDAANTGVDSSQGALESARGRLEVAQTGPQQVEQARAALALARARLAQTEASRRLAALNVSYATLRAPHDGVISRRTVEVGQMVDPSRALLAIVPADDIWVVANFKEDQVGAMRAGQRAELRVDAFPGRHFAARVESLAGATGARFSLLPPDNASGNFVKVTQRVPVLLRIDGAANAGLRPGLSADVTVFVDGR